MSTKTKDNFFVFIKKIMSQNNIKKANKKAKKTILYLIPKEPKKS